MIKGDCGVLLDHREIKGSLPYLLYAGNVLLLALKALNKMINLFCDICRRMLKVNAR